jgi:hypothetical protein
LSRAAQRQTSNKQQATGVEAVEGALKKLVKKDETRRRATGRPEESVV